MLQVSHAFCFSRARAAFSFSDSLTVCLQASENGEVNQTEFNDLVPTPALSIFPIPLRSSLPDVTLLQSCNIEIRSSGQVLAQVPDSP